MVCPPVVMVCPPVLMICPPVLMPPVVMYVVLPAALNPALASRLKLVFRPESLSLVDLTTGEPVRFRVALLSWN